MDIEYDKKKSAYNDTKQVNNYNAIQTMLDGINKLTFYAIHRLIYSEEDNVSL